MFFILLILLIVKQYDLQSFSEFNIYCIFILCLANLILINLPCKKRSFIQSSFQLQHIYSFLPKLKNNENSCCNNITKTFILSTLIDTWLKVLSLYWCQACLNGCPFPNQWSWMISSILMWLRSTNSTCFRYQCNDFLSFKFPYLRMFLEIDTLEKRKQFIKEY